MEGLADSTTGLNNLTAELRQVTNHCVWGLKSGYDKDQIMGCQQLGYNYMDLSRIDSARFYFHSGVKMAEKHKDHDSQWACSSGLGNIYKQLGKLDSALMVYQQNLAFAKKAKS